MNNKLKAAVIAAVGKDYLRDVCDHGADAGFPGFIYYQDTAKFYKKHKRAINALVEEMATDLGEEPFALVKGFKCLNNDFTLTEIAKTMYGRRTEVEKNNLIQIDNSLAWFALEEVARAECEK